MRSRRRPEAKGIEVLGHDKLNPKESDYTTILTKIKGLNPDGDLLRRRPASRHQARQAGLRHDAQHPEDGRRRHVLGRASSPTAGVPPRAGTHDRRAGHRRRARGRRTGSPGTSSKYGLRRQNYALTAYDARAGRRPTSSTRLVNDGRPINRSNSPRLHADRRTCRRCKASINFDDNGDLKDKVVSVFQVKDGAVPVHRRRATDLVTRCQSKFERRRCGPHCDSQVATETS